MRDFSILKKFNVFIHPPRTLIIKEVIWQPLIVNKINCGGIFRSIATSFSCGGIFRNYKAEFIYCFAKNIGIGSSSYDELLILSDALRIIDIVAHYGCHNLWMERKSSLVVHDF